MEHEVVVAAGLHHPEHVVGDADGGDEHTVAVQVGGFGEPIAQMDGQCVARQHAKSRSDELALVGIAPDLRPCHIESRRLNVECRLQQTVLRCQLWWSCQGLALYGRKVVGTSGTAAEDVSAGGGVAAASLISDADGPEAFGVSPKQPMKATNIATTTGPPALTAVLRMALLLILELPVREQTGVQRSASARQTDEADHILRKS